MRYLKQLTLTASLIGSMAAAPGWSRAHAANPGLGAVTTSTLPEGRSAQSRSLYLKLIDDMRQSGRTHAALAHLDAFDLQYPRSTDAAVMRGDCLVDIKAYAEATAIYRKLLKTGNAAAYAGLGRIEGLNGRWAAAAGEFSQAVARAPTASNYLGDYGYALMKAGKLDEALFRTRQAAELAPGDVRVRNNLILVMSAMGDTVGASALLTTIADPAERREVEVAVAANAQIATISAVPVAR